MKNDTDNFIAAVFIFYLLGFCRDMRRSVVFVLFRLKLISRREYSTEGFSAFRIMQVLDANFEIRLPKKHLYEAFGLSKGSFNKYFNELIQTNNLQGKRKLTLMEVYPFLLSWFGTDAKILSSLRFTAKSKKEISEILFNNQYKRLSGILDLIQLEPSMAKDKISPAVFDQIRLAAKRN